MLCVRKQGITWRESVTSTYAPPFFNFSISHSPLFARKFFSPASWAVLLALLPGWRSTNTRKRPARPGPSCGFLWLPGPSCWPRCRAGGLPVPESPRPALGRLVASCGPLFLQPVPVICWPPRPISTSARRSARPCWPLWAVLVAAPPWWRKPRPEAAAPALGRLVASCGPLFLQPVPVICWPAVLVEEQQHQRPAISARRLSPWRLFPSLLSFVQHMPFSVLSCPAW